MTIIETAPPTCLTQVVASSVSVADGASNEAKASLAPALCQVMFCASMEGAGCVLKTSGYFIGAVLKRPQREANQRANA